MMLPRIFRGGRGNPRLSRGSSITLTWAKGAPSTRALGSVSQQKQQAQVSDVGKGFGNGHSSMPLPPLPHLSNHSGITIGGDPTNSAPFPSILPEKQKQRDRHDVVGLNIDNATVVRPAGDTTTTLPMEGHEEFWRRVPIWENVSPAEFLSYRWGVSSIVFVDFPIIFTVVSQSLIG